MKCFVNIEVACTRTEQFDWKLSFSFVFKLLTPLSWIPRDTIIVSCSRPPQRKILNRKKSSFEYTLLQQAYFWSEILYSHTNSKTLHQLRVLKKRQVSLVSISAYLYNCNNDENIYPAASGMINVSPRKPCFSKRNKVSTQKLHQTGHWMKEMNVNL